MSSYALLPNSRSDPDNVYYTANIINNSTSTGGTQDDPEAMFNETRDVPIIRDANDFNVSVLKVSINGAGKDLPLLIPQIKPGPAEALVGITAGTSAGATVGLPLTYTVPSTWGLLVGDRVTVSGVTGDAQQILFNQTGMLVISLISNTSFVAISTSTGPTAITTITGTEGATALVIPNGLTNTIYTVTLNAVMWDDPNSDVKFVTSGPVNLQWIPENFDLGTPIPRTNTPTQEETDYYYLYTYNHWVCIINLALAEAYRRLGVFADAAQNGYQLLNRVPVVEYDENSEKFSFYTDTLGTNWGLSQGPPQIANLGPNGTNVFPTQIGEEFIYVGWDANFDLLLSNFDTQYFGKDQIIWGAGSDVSGPDGVNSTVYIPEETLIVRNKHGTNVQSAIDPSTGLPYVTPNLSYVTTQDFESTSTLWTPVGSIVLTTTLIPIRSEFVSGPVVLGKGNTNNGSGTSGTASFQTILCDFNDDIIGSKWRGMLVYTPTAEFIPVSLTTSHQEVKGIDFKINWRNRLTNQLIPLILPNTSSVQVRLLFRRKQS